MALWRWERGRQLSGYDKLLLLQSKWLKFDCYLLRFPTGSGIKPHNDPVPGWRHYRLNIVLKKAHGGRFICPNVTWRWGQRAAFFRSDIATHSVTEVLQGTRWVLSIGWLLKDHDTQPQTPA